MTIFVVCVLNCRVSLHRQLKMQKKIPHTLRQCVVSTNFAPAHWSQKVSTTSNAAAKEKLDYAITQQVLSEKRCCNAAPSRTSEIAKNCKNVKSVTEMQRIGQSMIFKTEFYYDHSFHPGNKNLGRLTIRTLPIELVVALSTCSEVAPRAERRT